jgi:DNA topoisomerase-1
MEIAQDLFEEGWISYHRTDNPNLSAESAQEVMDWLRQNNYAEHVADKANSWKCYMGCND